MQWILPVLEGVANFMFIFLSHFSTNFERFSAHLIANILNFPKHPLYALFWYIWSYLYPLFLRSHFFLTHPVDTFVNVSNSSF